MLGDDRATPTETSRSCTEAPPMGNAANHATLRTCATYNMYMYMHMCMYMYMYNTQHVHAHAHAHVQHDMFVDMSCEVTLGHSVHVWVKRSGLCNVQSCALRAREWCQVAERVCARLTCLLPAHPPRGRLESRRQPLSPRLPSLLSHSVLRCMSVDVAAENNPPCHTRLLLHVIIIVH